MEVPTISPIEPPTTLQTRQPNFLPPLFTTPFAAPHTLITQGAEALLFKSTYLLPSIPSALKYRPPKPYRHPTLDARLTRQRILAEARVLAKCRACGVPVPAVYALDEGAGWIMIEWIEGEVIRVRLNEWLGKRSDVVEGEPRDDTALRRMMARIGVAVGKMHEIGLVHGDLTTSNLMLRLVDGKASAGNGETNGRAADEVLDGEVVLIDFGLAFQNSQDEDKAVDLYVLERAFGSTHPRAEGLFTELLAAYGKSYKGANVVLKRLDGVRMRGRKKSMLG